MFFALSFRREAPHHDDSSTKKNALLDAIRVALLCGAAYFVLLEAFLSIPSFNGVTQIRPASGLSPVLGLLFGVPGALGCATGNLVSDIIHWPDDPALPLYVAIQLAYALALRIAWRIALPRDGAPRLRSAKHIAVFLIAGLLDSALVTGLLMPFEHDAMQALNIHLVRLFNNFLAIVYVGTPVMLTAERLRNSKRERQRTLSERFTLIALGLTALASALCVISLLAFRSAGSESTDGGNFEHIVAQIYLTLTAITVSLFCLVCVMLAVIERSLATPLNDLATDARTLARRMQESGPERMRDGVLDVHLSSDRALEEIQLVAHETNEMRHALGAIMINAQASVRERERIDTELSLAAHIQANALPADFSVLESSYGVGIRAIMKPARSVGGDFYDVFPLDEHRICALVADVSDKGIPAALFMMRAMTEARELLRSAKTLGEGLSGVSAHLCTNNDAMLFVTMFAIALDTRTGCIEFANAGHNLPVVCSPVRGNRWLSAQPGLPLGIMEDFSYASDSAILLPGEQIVLYTDGVTEARSLNDELFGNERLMQALTFESGADETSSSVMRMVDAVEAFSEGAEQADDLTALSLSWLPQGSWAHVPADAGLCMHACDFVLEHLSPEARGEMEFNLKLMVEELFVNCATHAYSGSEDRDCGIDVFIADDPCAHTVHLVLQDCGAAYDPTAHNVEGLTGTEQVDELQPGGLGILLVRKLSDSMRYERVDDRNTLHITKRYGR